MGDRTELVVLLDRSGSMQAARDDHEGGLRSFVRDQQRLAGDVRLTFVRFDAVDPFELVYDRTSLWDVKEDDFRLIPRGSTPLLDAVGRTLSHVRAAVATQDPPPDQVVVMIITDGYENASREWTKAKVKKLIEECEALGIWKILYLGANVDAFAEAGAIGIAVGTTSGYQPTGQSIGATYGAMSANLTAGRVMCAGGGGGGGAWSQVYNWTDAQRAAMGGASGGRPDPTGGSDSVSQTDEEKEGS